MTISFARHQFPPVIIRHAVWLYLRFTLSYRDVEDLLAERGLDVSYETVRRWVLKFGPLFARELRRRRPRPTPRWHLDEMAVMIGGRQFWLWRAIDDEGEVLDLLVQRRRDKAGETDAQAAQETRLRAQGAGDRQAALLRCGQVGDRIAGSPRAGLARKQSGGEFASTNTTAGAQDAAFQIARISTAFLVHSRRRPKHFQHSAPSHIPPHAPRPPRPRVPDVASRYRGMS